MARVGPQSHGKKTDEPLYRKSLSLEAPNYSICIQSNSAGFSFVNTGKQVHLSIPYGISNGIW